MQAHDVGSLSQSNLETSSAIYHLDLPTSEVEKKRLAYVSTNYVDDLTISALLEMQIKEGSLVLDVGAGSSPALGRRIKQMKLGYLALDRTKDAVFEQANGGNLAIRSSAEAIGLQSSSVGAVISRFCMGWLTPEQRDVSWRETVRVADANLSAIFQDYDWSVCEGSFEFTDLAKELARLLKVMGFDAYYGAQIKEDFATRAELLGGVGMKTERKSITPASPEGISAMIEMHTQSITLGLKRYAETAPRNVKDDLDHTINNLNDLKTLAVASINASNLRNFRLPDIVTVSLGKNIPTSSPAGRMILTGFDGKKREGVTITSATDPAALSARSVATRVYLNCGHITDGGVLIHEGFVIMNGHTDSDDLRRRSVVFAKDNTNDIHASLRLVLPDYDQVWSTPTGTLLRSQHKKGIDLNQMPFLTDKSVGEIHQIVNETPNPLESIVLVKEAIFYALKVGLDVIVFSGVVGRGKSADVFEKIYGPAKGIMLDDGSPAYVKVSGFGYNKNGITLKPFYVAVDTFFADMKDYMTNDPRGKLLPKPIRDAFGDYVEYDKVDAE